MNNKVYNNALLVILVVVFLFAVVLIVMNVEPTESSDSDFDLMVGQASKIVDVSGKGYEKPTTEDLAEPGFHIWIDNKIVTDLGHDNKWKLCFTGDSNAQQRQEFFGVLSAESGIKGLVKEGFDEEDIVAVSQGSRNLAFNAFVNDGITKCMGFGVSGSDDLGFKLDGIMDTIEIIPIYLWKNEQIDPLEPFTISGNKEVLN